MCKTLDMCFVWFVVFFFHNVNAVFKRKKRNSKTSVHLF